MKKGEKQEPKAEASQTAVVKAEQQAMSMPTIDDPIGFIKGQIELLHKLYTEVLKPNSDYGIIPGTDKPSLLKPGAEKITKMFRLVPLFEVTEKVFPNGHLRIDVKATLLKEGGEIKLGEGLGSCTTLESKFRFRNASRVCPECKKETIIKGKKEYGGGWLCFKKKGGCGKLFTDDDPLITSQVVGKVENENIADVYNTVLKMAKKRAFVDATLTVSGVSDLFTQDIEENMPNTDAVDEIPDDSPVDIPPKQKKIEKPETKEDVALNLARTECKKALNTAYDKQKEPKLTKQVLLEKIMESVGDMNLKGKDLEKLTENEYWALRKAALHWE